LLARGIGAAGIVSAAAVAAVARPGSAHAQTGLPPIRQPASASHGAFLARALELARIGSSRGDGTPYGSVVVHRGRIVGEAWNRATIDKDPTAHAEVAAIRDACRRLGRGRLDGMTLYASGGRPCPMCETACSWAGIATLWWGTDPAAPQGGGRPRYGGC